MLTHSYTLPKPATKISSGRERKYVGHAVVVQRTVDTQAVQRTVARTQAVQRTVGISADEKAAGIAENEHKAVGMEP